MHGKCSAVLKEQMVTADPGLGVCGLEPEYQRS